MLSARPYARGRGSECNRSKERSYLSAYEVNALPQAATAGIAPSLDAPRHHSRHWYRLWYRNVMETARKITVEVPPELLEKAQQATGAGITQTIRVGLELVAASQTYANLRQARGKVRFSRTLAELKADR